MIDNEVVIHYGMQFQAEPHRRDYPILRHISKLIFDEDNRLMEQLPDEAEVRETVYDLNTNNASGPDGITGAFYQSCRKIIGEDITRLVRDLLCGQEMTKFITHTSLVLVPKKEIMKSFTDFTPISLSSFIDKIISKVIYWRISLVLPKIISQNQSGFIKDRNIPENVLLLQEIIRDIGKRNKNVNVVVKLDMEKTYDRVS